MDCDVEKERRREEMRGKVAKELYSTEELYVKSLKVCIEIYYKQLQDLTPPILTFDELKTLFSDIHLIYLLNESFLAEIIPVINNWNESSRIGSLLLNIVKSSRVYSTYVQNHESAMVLLKSLRVSNEKFAAFIKTQMQDPRTKGQDLAGFLILPVQRIPRYSLLIRELLKYTPTHHADYPFLQKAAKEADEVNNFLNAKKREALNAIKKLEISEKLHGSALKIEVNDPARRYIREGITTDGQLLFLFNDILILGNPEKTKKKGDNSHASSVEVIDVLFVRDVNIEENAQGINIATKRGKFVSFNINISKGEINEWLEDFSELAKENADEKHSTSTSSLASLSQDSITQKDSKQRSAEELNCTKLVLEEQLTNITKRLIGSQKEKKRKELEKLRESVLQRLAETCSTLNKMEGGGTLKKTASLPTFQPVSPKRPDSEKGQISPRVTGEKDRLSKTVEGKKTKRSLSQLFLSSSSSSSRSSPDLAALLQSQHKKTGSCDVPEPRARSSRNRRHSRQSLSEDPNIANSHEAANRYHTHEGSGLVSQYIPDQSPISKETKHKRSRSRSSSLCSSAVNRTSDLISADINSLSASLQSLSPEKLVEWVRSELSEEDLMLFKTLEYNGTSIMIETLESFQRKGLSKEGSIKLHNIINSKLHLLVQNTDSLLTHSAELPETSHEPPSISQLSQSLPAPDLGLSALALCADDDAEGDEGSNTESMPPDDDDHDSTLTGEQENSLELDRPSLEASSSESTEFFVLQSEDHPANSQ